MAIQNLPANVRPAKTGQATSMSASVARAIENARLHLRTGNAGAYARALAGEHRAQSARQQRAIEAVIMSDATSHLFTRHAGNGCLLAREG